MQARRTSRPISPRSRASSPARSARRSSGPGSSSTSTARRSPSRSTSTARCGRRSSSTCSRTRSSSRSRATIARRARARPTAQVELVGARHRHRHPARRAAAPVRALPPRRGRARPHARGHRHRPGAGAGARAAARRHASTVESELGAGTHVHRHASRSARAHLPADRVATRPRAAATAASAPTPFVEEALRWLPDERGRRRADRRTPTPARDAGGRPRARILLADDNADMREYVRAAAARRAGTSRRSATARAALDAVAAQPARPRAHRRDDAGARRLRPAARAARRRRSRATLPVIMLSARAGEEARVEGLEAGADDYLVKPFSARELLARVEAQLLRARIRAGRRGEHARRLDAVFAQAPVGDRAAARARARLRARQPDATASWSATATLVGKPVLEALPELDGPRHLRAARRRVRTRRSRTSAARCRVLDRPATDGAPDEHFFDFVYQPLAATTTARSTAIAAVVATT